MYFNFSWTMISNLSLYHIFPGPKILSKEEAVEFTEKQLGVTDILEETKNNQLGALNKLIKSCHMKFPFQNVTLLSKNPGTTDVPTLEETKNDVMEGHAGLCYTNNLFMHFLLKALGYRVDFAAGHCENPNCHLINVVILDGNEQYLVDVGVGAPTFPALPVLKLVKEGK